MPSRPLKVLVVDDEEAMREVLEMRLQGWGYDVCLAATGAEGCTMAESSKPDVVVSDVVMPGLSGLELLAALKTSDPQRPIILITAQGSIDLAVEAMKQGAQDFLTKPLDYGKLKAILEAIHCENELRKESRTAARRRARCGLSASLPSPRS